MEKSFYIIYDIIITLLTIVPVMFLNISGIAIVNLELGLVIIILMALYILHQKDMPTSRTSWLILLMCGLGILGFSFLYEPIWWKIARFIISGQIQEADALLNSPKSNGNPFVFIGIAACYTAVIGFIRALIKSMLVRFQLIGNSEKYPLS